MKNFINANFLLENKYSKELYHNYAKELPIIDYHNHLSPKEIADNRSFDNITKLWLEGDHYKWRAMRALGIAENDITGTTSDKEKFEKWAYTMPYAIRNPLYHWSHLELQRYFDIEKILNPDSAPSIYNQCNEMLALPAFTTQGLLKSRNVELLCTTDDPLDDLSDHTKISNSKFKTKVLPTFRPDKIIDIDKIDFLSYLEDLSKCTNIKVVNLESLLNAVKIRIDYFHKKGCRLSDHGLSQAFAEDFSEKEIDTILKNKQQNKTITEHEIIKFKSGILFYLGTFYAEKKWTMQLHLGPLRDTNKLLLKNIGNNVGVDSIGDYKQAEQLSGFLNRLNEKAGLPQTIIYNSNSNDNEVFATMAGNFSEDGIKGKVQFGAAWWFLDQKEGITKQINALSNMGLLSTSLGMLTDSRSFMSFPRHEYYRRILSNVFGNDIKKGELPNDMEWMGKVIQDICYNNPKEYFNFPE